jgi:hypothetical protein
MKLGKNKKLAIFEELLISFKAGKAREYIEKCYLSVISIRTKVLLLSF